MTIDSIQGIIRDLRDRGISILITDHQVRETLEITDRSYVIRAGQVLCHGRPREVLQQSRSPQVLLRRRDGREPARGGVIFCRMCYNGGHALPACPLLAASPRNPGRMGSIPRPLPGIAAIAFGVPVLGYVCMVLDFRAYLRSLRRALVVVTGYRTELPEWMRKNTPRCILALGLVMPCTAEEVLAAYRRKVKTAAPDRGGDRREFLRLQAQFEEAMAFVEGK